MERTEVEARIRQNTLVEGIKGWSLDVEDIQLRVAMVDFGSSNTVDKYQENADEGVTLAEGWIPTKDSMIAFLKHVLEDQSDLKRFNLAILAGGDASDGNLEKWAQVFEFDFVNHDTSTPNDHQVANTSARPSVIGDAWDTALATNAGLPSGSEIKTIIGHAAIRALFDNTPERMELSRLYGEMRARMLQVTVLLASTRLASSRLTLSRFPLGFPTLGFAPLGLPSLELLPYGLPPLGLPQLGLTQLGVPSSDSPSMEFPTAEFPFDFP
jgi:hypothetical protein